MLHRLAHLASARLVTAQLAWALCLTIAAAPLAHADETHRGRLEEGDLLTPRQNDNANGTPSNNQIGGERYDRYEIHTQPGQQVSFDLQARGFGAYLIAISPSDVLYEARAYRGDPANARLSMVDLEGGMWTVIVTSSTREAEGDYTLQATMVDAGLGDPARAEADQLGRGDTIENLHFVDTFTVPVEAGERVLVDLTSRRFDTLLKVEMPNGQPHENDDFQGAINHSRVQLLATESGEMTIHVQSFDVQGEGPYLLRVYTTDSGIAQLDRPSDTP